MEIKGDTYWWTGSMFTQVQGYIYNDSIINYSVNHLGVVKFDHLYAMNVSGNLVFWFARIDYWQSFSVCIYNSSAGNYWKNQCTSITDAVKPNGTKEIDLCNNTFYSWNTDNLGSLTTSEIDTIMV